MPKKLPNKRTTLRAKAMTRDVVGELQANVSINPKWQRHYRRLVNLHNYLLNRKIDQVADAKEEKPIFSLHMADAGTDNYDQDFALSMISSEQDAIYEIEEAINRITEGTYGICQLTGKRIEANRLSAIPWTRFSVEAEQKLEREGTIHHTKLGVREEVAKGESGEEEEAKEEE